MCVRVCEVKGQSMDVRSDLCVSWCVTVRRSQSPLHTDLMIHGLSRFVAVCHILFLLIERLLLCVYAHERVNAHSVTVFLCLMD